jgi:hypothetical protein
VRTRILKALVIAAAIAAAACASVATLSGPAGTRLRVPYVSASALEPVAPGDSAYAAAGPAAATGVPGAGKLVAPYVVRLTRDLPVYRLWPGPDVKDAQGRTSRIGAWWTFEPPAGTLASYRRRYEVCDGWSSLRWVASCTLRRGAVVVVGLGQSVSAATCGKPGESYPASDRDVQVYIHEPWKHTGTPGSELSCPDPSRDYENDPQDIAKPARPQ